MYAQPWAQWSETDRWTYNLIPVNEHWCCVAVMYAQPWAQWSETDRWTYNLIPVNERWCCVAVMYAQPWAQWSETGRWTYAVEECVIFTLPLPQFESRKPGVNAACKNATMNSLVHFKPKKKMLQSLRHSFCQIKWTNDKVVFRCCYCYCVVVVELVFQLVSNIHHVQRGAKQ